MRIPHRPMYDYPPHPSRRRRRHAGRSGDLRSPPTEERGQYWLDRHSPYVPDFSSALPYCSLPVRHRNVCPEPRKEQPKQELRDTTVLYSAVDKPYHCTHCNKLIYGRGGQSQIREKCTTCTSINYCSDCFVDGKHLPEHASHTFINVHSYPRNTKLPEDYADIEVQRVLFPIQKSVLHNYSCFATGKANNQFTETMKILRSKPLWVWNAIWTWLQQQANNTTPTTSLDDPITLDKAPKIEIPDEYEKSNDATFLGKAEPILQNAITMYGITKQLKLNALRSAQVQILSTDGETYEDPVVLLYHLYDNYDDELRQWAKLFMTVSGNAEKMLGVKEYKAGLMALFTRDGRAAMDFVEALVDAREKASKEAWWPPRSSAAWTGDGIRDSPSPEWMYQDGRWWRRTPRGGVHDL